jgi:glycerophosphoryl diester phosphodiesterase
MKPALRLIILTVGALGFLFAGSTMLRTCAKVRVHEEKSHPLLKVEFPLVALHGGDQERPANSEEAFDHAAQQQAWLHFDLRLTKDNRLVVTNDPVFEKTAKGPTFIVEKTLSEIQANRKMLTIEDMFEKYQNHVLLIDLQENSLPAAIYIVELIEKKGLQDKVIFTSPFASPLNEFRKLHADWLTLSTTGEIERVLMLTSFNLESAATIKGDFLMAPIKKDRIDLLTPQVINESHLRHKKVIAIVNTEHEAQSAFGLGVDGIATDKPELLRGIIGSRHK